MKFFRAALLLSIFVLVVRPDALSQVKGLNLDGPRLTPSAAPAPTTPPETPSAFVRPQRVQSKPMPLPWKITIAATIFLLSAVSLAVAARAWRTWNLFDRQYRFPPSTTAALRFGAVKSGGCMATLVFHESADSTAEDA